MQHRVNGTARCDPGRCAGRCHTFGAAIRIESQRHVNAPSPRLASEILVALKNQALAIVGVRQKALAVGGVASRDSRKAILCQRFEVPRMQHTPAFVLRDRTDWRDFERGFMFGGVRRIELASEKQERDKSQQLLHGDFLLAFLTLGSDNAGHVK